MAMPKLFLRVWSRYPVTMTIGEPFKLLKPGRINAESVEDGTRLIMERIAALLPEGQRGYYEYISSQGSEPASP